MVKEEVGKEVCARQDKIYYIVVTSSLEVLITEAVMQLYAIKILVDSLWMFIDN